MGVQTLQGFLSPTNRSKGKADALVLTCIDYRYLHIIPDYLRDNFNPKLTYDHSILAGASLGVFAGVFPGWASTFWEHLEVAIALHEIHSVYILDHRDCGAYREFEALPDTPDPASPGYPAYHAQETTIHQHYMDRLSALITKSHPKLKVVTRLLDVPKSECHSVSRP